MRTAGAPSREEIVAAMASLYGDEDQRRWEISEGCEVGTTNSGITSIVTFLFMFPP